MRFHRRCAPTILLAVLPALAWPAAAADLPHPPRAVRHHAAVRPAPSRVVVVAPEVVVVAPEVGAARPPLPSPTALVLPGAGGVPAYVDLSPVFAPQRACGPGFSPDALQACRRHGELHVDCGPSGTDCVPLPPDPIPYGPGAAARLAY